MSGIVLIGIVLLISSFTLGCLMVFGARKIITRDHNGDTSNSHAKEHSSDFNVKAIKINVIKTRNESNLIEARAQRLSQLLDIKQGGREGK